MLALATGWTPDVLAELPMSFRASCHWALYAAAIAGPEGLPSTDIPKGASQETRLAILQQSAHIGRLRTVLYPEGD